MVGINKTIQCVVASSIGWSVLKVYWIGSSCVRRGWQSNFFQCKSRNKDKKLWKCGYCISWHRYICIYTTPLLQTEVLWSGRVMVCFRSRKLQNVLAHSWSCLVRFELSWNSNSNPCPHWTWYSQQSWYRKHSCQGRSWLLPLTVSIYHLLAGMN